MNEIIKYPLSIAVFGQAFTYECQNSFMDREKYMNNEDRFWLAREGKLTEVANSGGFCLNDSEANLDKESGRAKMLQDWHITEHSGHGKWEIDQKSATEFETVASHELNTKRLEVDFA